MLIKTHPFQNRSYRSCVASSHLVSFTVTVKETDLSVYADTSLEIDTRERVLEQRSIIEAYIRQYPDFATTLRPWKRQRAAPPIIRDMIEAAEKADVGPMAAVAGAIAEHVGKGLLTRCREVIIENGGDIFLKTEDPVVIGLYAGGSPLSLRLGIRVQPDRQPLSVCTSSGTVGHSLSLGAADAVCVQSGSGSLADAAATAVGNRVASKKDIQQGIDYGRSIPGVSGVVIVVEDKIGIWGDVEVVPLDLKKG